jgi:hypothetical protein
MTLLATTGEAVSGAPSETTVLPKWWAEYSGIIFLGFAMLAYSIGKTRFAVPMALFLGIAVIVAANHALLGKSTKGSISNPNTQL